MKHATMDFPAGRKDWRHIITWIGLIMVVVMALGFLGLARPLLLPGIAKQWIVSDSPDHADALSCSEVALMYDLRRRPTSIRGVWPRVSPLAFRSLTKARMRASIATCCYDMASPPPRSSIFAFDLTAPTAKRVGFWSGQRPAVQRA